MGSRPRWRSVWPTACSAVALAACGGGDEPLAARSEAIAAALARGDACTAAREADALVEEVIAAVNAGDVPARLQEDVLSRAQSLAARVDCPRAEPDAEAAALELARLLREN